MVYLIFTVGLTGNIYLHDTELDATLKEKFRHTKQQEGRNLCFKFRSVNGNTDTPPFCSSAAFTI
jgi:hypothetical protein